MHSRERVGLDFIDSAAFRFVSTVNMRRGIVGDEEFLAWEPHSHMAFRFNEASTSSIACAWREIRLIARVWPQMRAGT